MTDNNLKNLNTEVIRTGREVILPVGMSYNEGIRWLKRRRDEDEQEVEINRSYSIFPTEGAIALQKAMARRYGWVMAKATQNMFGYDPPKAIAMEVALGVTEQVPFGRFEIPNITGYVESGITMENGLPCFYMNATVQKRYQTEVEELYSEIAIIAHEETPYRAAAIRIPAPNAENASGIQDLFPKFIDVRTSSKDQMVFSTDIEDLLADNVFGPVAHTEDFRDHQIPLKMGILLEGQYGCGKTLVANVLAKHCTENQWTYILCERASDLARCVRVARRFEPCVVFCEDIDREMGGSQRTDHIDQLLNTIDGIESKGTEIMIVLTTNHVEQLTAAMRRPGRLDVVIPIVPPDAEAVTRMIALYAGDQIDINADLSQVGQLLEGRTPAVIREVVERAKRTAIVLDKPDRLSAEALTRAAKGMSRHLDLLDEEVKEVPRNPIESLADAVRYHGDKQ
jgi:transitional endoplasmic reticulum ATPase